MSVQKLPLVSCARLLDEIGDSTLASPPEKTPDKKGAPTKKFGLAKKDGKRSEGTEFTKNAALDKKARRRNPVERRKRRGGRNRRNNNNSNTPNPAPQEIPLATNPFYLKFLKQEEDAKQKNDAAAKANVAKAHAMLTKP